MQIGQGHKAVKDVQEFLHVEDVEWGQEDVYVLVYAIGVEILNVAGVMDLCIKLTICYYISIFL